MEIDSFRVLCNEIELEQVLINLINNAIDAAEAQSERWVNIYVESKSSLLLIRIVDSGKGMSIEVKKKIFNPFFTTKKVGEGTGLGLSIAKGIIEDHKGTLVVVNDSEHTCFEITLPLLDSIEQAV